MVLQEPPPPLPLSARKTFHRAPHPPPPPPPPPPLIYTTSPASPLSIHHPPPPPLSLPPPAAAGTTCVSHSPTSAQFTVTVHVEVAHGLNPGQGLTLAGFTPSGYNETYSALAGTSGTTLVGAYSNGTGTCPGTVTAEGNVGTGSGAAITVTAPSRHRPIRYKAARGFNRARPAGLRHVRRVRR